jgi:hypothetical protein
MGSRRRRVGQVLSPKRRNGFRLTLILEFYSESYKPTLIFILIAQQKQDSSASIVTRLQVGYSGARLGTDKCFLLIAVHRLALMSIQPPIWCAGNSSSVNKTAVVWS